MTTSFRKIAGLLAYFTAFVSPINSQTTVTVTTNAQATPRPVMLLTGDSLTEQGTYPSSQGWVALLQARYTRSSDVITRGLSGYNTKWFLKYAMPILEQEISSGAYSSPSFITLWLGTNDAVLVNGSNPEMYVPIDDYKKNLFEIANAFQSAAPGASIMLITPPHIDDDARAKYAAERTDVKRGLVDRSNVLTGNYSRACVEVATSLKVPVLDLYAHFNAMPAATRNAMLADGIHFNAAGNKAVDEQLRSKITAEFPTLDKALQTWQSPAAIKWVSDDPWKADNMTETTS